MGDPARRGSYLGSVSTYYRVLRKAGESRERRAKATHPAAVKPELVAAGPNQVCSWGITKLHGPREMGLLPPLRDPRRALGRQAVVRGSSRAVEVWPWPGHDDGRDCRPP